MARCLMATRQPCAPPVATQGALMLPRTSSCSGGGANSCATRPQVAAPSSLRCSSTTKSLFLSRKLSTWSTQGVVARGGEQRNRLSMPVLTGMGWVMGRALTAAPINIGAPAHGGMRTYPGPHLVGHRPCVVLQLEAALVLLVARVALGRAPLGGQHVGIVLVAVEGTPC